MPSTKADLEVFVPPAEFKAVVLDVERYPDFLEEVKRVEVKERTDSSVLAQFWVEVAFAGLEIKTEYTLRYTITDDGVSWTLDSSPDLTKNEGCWRLEEGDDDDETLAHYEAEIVTSLPISPEIQAMFAEQTLPELMDKFRDRAESL